MSDSERRLYRIRQGIAGFVEPGGEAFGFGMGQIVSVRRGEHLPPVLARNAEEYTGPAPLDVIAFDAATWAKRGKSVAAPPEPEPIEATDLRKRLRLADPAMWELAKVLGFPVAARLHRDRPGPLQLNNLGAPVVDILWPVAPVQQWIDRVKRLAAVLPDRVAR